MKAKGLKKGDTIGVIAQSEPVLYEDIEPSVEIMKRLGINVVFAEHTFQNPTGYGETAKNKAKDINTMFEDNKIDAIWCANRWI